MTELKASKELEIRFSEVDMMNVVWHGSYALYFEDARETFGAKYDLSYMGYIQHGYYAPIVEQTIQYKKPLRYGMKPRIDIYLEYLRNHSAGDNTRQIADQMFKVK